MLVLVGCNALERFGPLAYPAALVFGPLTWTLARNYPKFPIYFVAHKSNYPIRDFSWYVQDGLLMHGKRGLHITVEPEHDYLTG